MKRILYIQYTNPAGYPPLEHSSRILADAGWQVLFLGTGAQGAHALRFPPHPNIAVRQLDFCPGGWRQKLHYSHFCLWVVARAILWRAGWVSASDPLACPPALLLTYLPGFRVLYHEHDSPGRAAGLFQRMVLAARKRLARRADCCVLPNEKRLEHFRTETGTGRPVFCVWNCPSSREAATPRGPANDSLCLLYHGSIVSDRLPLTVVRALSLLPDRVRLRIVGYETVGSPGYIERLRQEAERLGIAARLEFVGPVSRAELLEWCRRSDVGLSLLPLSTADVNQETMTGASNKAFDYLACGLPFLVSDLPDWRAMYVEPGYALACDPGDAESIARTLRVFLDDPNLTHSMGERGRQRILSDWNYEARFEPVWQCLEAWPAGSAAQCMNAAGIRG